MSDRSFCTSYTGSQTVCHAGIAIESVRDLHGRVPCAVIRGITGELACDKLSFPPPSPQAAKGEMVLQLERMFAGQCPRCGELIAGEMEFNGALLAMPCRHVIRGARE